MKKRKDSGFTLIELMIVIAVIGILAIVLVPKVGVIKTQAKETGLDTNIRLVQGYVESKINKWVSTNTSRAIVAADITNAFTFTDTTKELVNPLTSVTDDAISLTEATIGTATGEPVIVLTDDEPTLNATYTNAAGSVIVTISDGGPITKISVYAYGSGGKQLSEKTINITP